MEPFTWRSIEGWFDFEDIYSEALDRVNRPAAFVEVGAWLGRSTAYMAGEIMRRGLPVRFFAVDTWAGTPGDGAMEVTAALNNGDLYPAWDRNMRRAGVRDYVCPLQMRSVHAAVTFPYQSLDFIFIDGDHSYRSVRADLDAWLPRLRAGGVIAGHDIDQATVEKAVVEVLGDRYERRGLSWIAPPLLRLCS